MPHLTYLECGVVKGEKIIIRQMQIEIISFCCLLHLDLPPLALSNSQFPCHLHTKCSLLSELCTLLPLNTKSPQITALFVESTFGHVSLGSFLWTKSPSVDICNTFTRRTRALGKQD